MKKPSTKEGFTLIELLIVIAVIGILAAGVTALVNPVAQFQKANDSRRKSDLSQIQRAFETFYQDNGKYPAYSTTEPIYRIVGLDGSAVNWGLPWTPYMGTLPKDPSSSKKYVYYSTANGQTYYIYASLDREVNVLSHFPSDANCSSGAVVIECNYGVSSPNVSP